MPADIVNDFTEIQDAGSDFAYIKEVKSDGTDLGTPDTYVRLPIKASSLFEDSQPDEPVMGESKRQVASSQGLRTVRFEITLMQDSAKVEKFLRFGVRNKYFSIVNGCGLDGNNATDFPHEKIRHMPICKISPMYSSTAPDGRRPVASGTVILNKAAITFGSVSTAISTIIADLELDATAGAALSFTTAIGKYADVVNCKKA